MPISKKQFEEGNFSVLRGRALDIIEFLKKNKDSAYTAKEIADNFKTKSVSINPTLKKLVDKGLLERKKPYYTFVEGKPNVSVLKPILPPKPTALAPKPALTPSGLNAKKIHLNPEAKGEELEEEEFDDLE